MNQLADVFIAELLEDESFFAEGEIPKSISMYAFAGSPTAEVLAALSTLHPLGVQWCGEPPYAEVGRYMQLLNGDVITLRPESLIVVLHYKEHGQRILELHLSSTKATLHFVKD